MNQLKRGPAFDSKLKLLDGFENTDLLLLKTELKTIKTVYWQEIKYDFKVQNVGTRIDDGCKPISD